MAGESVKCTACGWRGRRAYQSCECLDYCTHNGLGACPKCGASLETIAWLRQNAEDERRAREWENTPEGKAEIARLLQREGG